jgi:hypothetical protein
LKIKGTLTNNFETGGFSVDGTTDIVGASILSPETGEVSTLGIPLNSITDVSDISNIELTMQRNGMALAPNVDAFATGNSVLMPDGTRVSVVYPESSRSYQTSVCETWRIERLLPSGEIESIYSEEDVVHLSNLTALEDGSVLFLRWKFEGCLPNVPMSVSLLRLHPDGNVSTVAEGVTPIEDGRTNLFGLPFAAGHRFAVSPDEIYVVWPSGDLNNRQARLNITNLNTGDQAVLMEFAGSNDSGRFLDNQMFRAVFWIN